MSTQAIQNQETHTRILKEDLEKLKQIQNSTGASNLTEALHKLINNQEPSALTLVNLLDQDMEYLNKIQKEVGCDLGHVIHQIIKSQSSIEIVTPSKIMVERVPICLVGRNMSGKSFFLKTSFIPTVRDNPNSFTPSTKDNQILVIDTNSEYDLKEIKSIRELSNNPVARFCPLQNSTMCMIQVRQLFTEMNSLIDMDKEALKNLILVVEEAQSFKSSWFNGFLYRSRHIVRKMIVVTPQIDCFQGLMSFTVFR